MIFATINSITEKIHIMAKLSKILLTLFTIPENCFKLDTPSGFTDIPCYIDPQVFLLYLRFLVPFAPFDSFELHIRPEWVLPD